MSLDTEKIGYDMTMRNLSVDEMLNQCPPTSSLGYEHDLYAPVAAILCRNKHLVHVEAMPGLHDPACLEKQGTLAMLLPVRCPECLAHGAIR